MKTVGEVLKRAREKRGRSLAQISKETKIKERFLAALEENNFPGLPDFPVALGFARNYAQAVGVEPGLVSALMRRDFPQTKPQPSSVKMPLVPQAIWTPKTTIAAAVLATTLALTVYLGRQYALFAASPPLEITQLSAKDEKVEIVGKTTPYATVQVNGRSVLVEEDGSFHFTLRAPENGALEIEAVSRAGKRTTIRKTL